MNTEQLALWLQGMLEYRDVGSISGSEALKMLQGIKDHVALVFNKVTPVVEKPVEKKDSVKKDSEEDERLKKIFKDLKPAPSKPVEYPQPFIWPSPRGPYDFDKRDYWLDRQTTGVPVIT